MSLFCRAFMCLSHRALMSLFCRIFVQFNEMLLAV